MQVVRQMRQRGMGNSSSQVQKQLEEQHSKVWLHKQLQFLTDCRGLMQTVASGLMASVDFGDLPAMLTVPKHRWLMQVYSQDVLSRLEEIKASITSQFCRVLKMDSTKKMVKKLARESRATASWATNIGNEHGQIVMSVLTASEGYDMGKMASSAAGHPLSHLQLLQQQLLLQRLSFLSLRLTLMTLLVQIISRAMQQCRSWLAALWP